MVAVRSWQEDFIYQESPSFLLYFTVLSLACGFYPQDYLVIIRWLLQLQPSHLHFRQEEIRGKDKKKPASQLSL